MATVDLVMPKMGESIMEATILKWHKQAGDMVKMDETVLEIATDKVDTEVPSTAEGVMEEVLFNVNDVVPVGAIIARVKTGANEQMNKEQESRNIEQGTRNVEEGISHKEQGTRNYEQRTTTSDELITNEKPEIRNATTNYQQSTTNENNNRFYSPLVLNIAAQEGVKMSDLENINGTGNEGRVTKKDILQFVSERRGKQVQSSQFTVQRQQDNEPKQQSNALTTIERQPSTSYGGNVEILEMDRMRRLIADHMIRSKHTSPHVTSFTEADVTNLVMWRNKVKNDFEKREGTKITFTPLFIEAVVRCIKKFPLINSSIDGNNIIIKKDINIGMATALPSGNLIVPVIKNADGFNLVGLSKKVNGLADAARNNKLKPEDIADGTFTLTNVGTFGSLMGTPIINQPQVAILAVGAIKKRPVVIETPHGDSIAIRHMMYLSMSYDHRIVDGSLGATFLTAVANELENFNANKDF
jgi:2-oxoglutarate dehydrogenase E2 component (dihydrolipoamide succinyltransferase)